MNSPAFGKENQKLAADLSVSSPALTRSLEGKRTVRLQMYTDLNISLQFAITTQIHLQMFT
jgi:hypothetical protein